MKKLPGNFSTDASFSSGDKLLGYQSDGDAVLYSPTVYADGTLTPLVIPVTTEAELLAALEEVQDGVFLRYGPVIELPYGEIVLTDQLYINVRKHLHIRGKGSGASILSYQGPDNVDAIFCARPAKMIMEGFTLKNDSGNSSVAGILLRTVMRVDALDQGTDVHLAALDSGAQENDIRVKGTKDTLNSGQIATECLHRDVVVDGFTRGFSSDSSGSDSNNEFNKWFFCEAKNCTDSGFYTNGTQIHRNQYKGCTARDCNNGMRAAQGNYWNWRQGRGINNINDFIITGNTFLFQCIIDGYYSTGSEQFVRHQFANNFVGIPLASTGLIVRNVRWEGQPSGYDNFVFHSNFQHAPIQCSHFKTTNGYPLRIKPGAGARLFLSTEQSNVDDETLEPVLHSGSDDTLTDPFIPLKGFFGDKNNNRWWSIPKESNLHTDDRQTISLSGKTTSFSANAFETFTWAELSLSSPSSSPYTKSFSIACDITPSSVSGNLYLWCLNETELTLRANVSSNTSVRVELTSRATTTSGLPVLVAGNTYRAVLVYNRDEEKRWMAIGKVGNADEGYVTTFWNAWFEDGDDYRHQDAGPNIMQFSRSDSGFAGTIANVDTWTRALTKAEVEAEDVGGVRNAAADLLG